jgi:hypothetical protein
VCLSGLVVAAQGGGKYSAALGPDQEVPVVSSQASGTITLDIDEDNDEITYELTFSGLSSTVAQSHIHAGQPGVNGGIMLWLCEGTSTSPLASTPTCPQSGTVSGTLTPADVVAITGTNAGQQISAGEFAEAVALIKKGLAYANVHTANSPGGEIRGLIRQGGGHK